MPSPSMAPADTVTIVIGGDIGFGGSGQPVAATGAQRHGARVGFDAMTSGLAPLLDGDVTFANLETVITERNDLVAIEKAFNFRSHPAAVRHMLKLGFNAVSAANNHAADYGDAGLTDTLRHLGALSAHGLQAFPGIGLGRLAATAPHGVSVRGVTVNISAIGIGAGGLGVREATHRPALAFYGSAADVADTAAALKAAGGEVRMLSVHYGIEMQVRPSAADEQRLRGAANAADAHIVAGHHAHVAAGVQITDGRVLFYGLGNLLHPGMQDMSRHGLCRDYGLLARIHLARTAGRFEVRAIEAVALADMQSATRARTGEDGRTRIAVLNHLAAGLDRPGSATGVRFAPQIDGTGLWCADGAATDAGRIGALCRSHRGPEAPSAELARRITASCGGDVVSRAPTGPGQGIHGVRAATGPVRTTVTTTSGSTSWSNIMMADPR